MANFIQSIKRRESEVNVVQHQTGSPFQSQSDAEAFSNKYEVWARGVGQGYVYGMNKHIRSLTLNKFSLRLLDMSKSEKTEPNLQMFGQFF